MYCLHKKTTLWSFSSSMESIEVGLSTKWRRGLLPPLLNSSAFLTFYQNSFTKKDYCQRRMPTHFRRRYSPFVMQYRIYRIFQDDQCTLYFSRVFYWQAFFCQMDPDGVGKIQFTPKPLHRSKNGGRRWKADKILHNMKWSLKFEVLLFLTGASIWSHFLSLV